MHHFGGQHCGSWVITRRCGLRILGFWTLPPNWAERDLSSNWRWNGVDNPRVERQTLDGLAETSEVGDWKMPDFRAACSYAVSQNWLIVATAEAMSRQEPMIYVAELRLAIDLVNLTCSGGPGTDTSREALNLALARKVDGFYRAINAVLTTVCRQRRNLRLVTT